MKDITNEFRNAIVISPKKKQIKHQPTKKSSINSEYEMLRNQNFQLELDKSYEELLQRITSAEPKTPSNRRTNSSNRFSSFIKHKKKLSSEKRSLPSKESSSNSHIQKRKTHISIDSLNIIREEKDENKTINLSKTGSKVQSATTPANLERSSLIKKNNIQSYIEEKQGENNESVKKEKSEKEEKNNYQIEILNNIEIFPSNIKEFKLDKIKNHRDSEAFSNITPYSNNLNGKFYSQIVSTNNLKKEICLLNTNTNNVNEPKKEETAKAFEIPKKKKKLRGFCCFPLKL